MELWLAKWHQLDAILDDSVLQGKVLFLNVLTIVLSFSLYELKAPDRDSNPSQPQGKAISTFIMPSIRVCPVHRLHIQECQHLIRVKAGIWSNYGIFFLCVCVKFMNENFYRRAFLVIILMQYYNYSFLELVGVLQEHLSGPWGNLKNNVPFSDLKHYLTTCYIFFGLYSW